MNYVVSNLLYRLLKCEYYRVSCKESVAYFGGILDLQVVVLSVSLHCKGCESKVRKHLSKMEGGFSEHLSNFEPRALVYSPSHLISEVHKFLTSACGGVGWFLCRSDVVQHRHGNEESDGERRRDAFRCSDQRLSGEECSALAIFDNLFFTFMVLLT